MDVARFLFELEADPHYAGQIAGRHTLPARRGRSAPLDPPLPPLLAEALATLGIDRLYTHQVEAIDAARAGRDVLMVTGTASGKTLGYNAPVIERVLAERGARALYLFPLKALAADQQRQLTDLGLWERVRCATYDGDTPTHERRAVRDVAHVVLTNPDMLHQAILPRHDLWSDFLGHLRYVVIDEVHTYRGVFGAHAAHVFRRLLRLCERYGARPQFLCSSATIANPVELARALTGRRDWTLVDRDGAPHGRQRIVVWNPPVLDAATGRRRSGNLEATWLLAELVRRGIKSLGFAVAREEAELVLRYLRGALDADRPPRGERVAAYRAGYLAGERRELERKLSSGELTALVSTVALEAGIDIGSLDATVLIGYPGTQAGFRQQAGRAGRRGEESLAVLVTRDSLVDQYFARHPEALWSRPSEQARLNPDNVYILGGHLLCAAYEQPLSDADVAAMSPVAEQLLPIFAEEGLLTRRGGRWMYAGRGYPAAGISLRSATEERWTLADAVSGETLELDDGARVWDRYYPGAVHLHQGEQYVVKETDATTCQVRLEAVRVPYFTQPTLKIDVAIDEVTAERHLGPIHVRFGDVTVTRQTLGFRRLHSVSREVIEMVDLDCPERQLETAALWLTLDAELLARLAAEERDVLSGLHAVEHALAAALPLVAMCDVRDVQGSSTAAHAGLGGPASFLYDTYPGGIGLVEAGFEAIEALWRRTLEVVAACPCDGGCPACIQAGFCGSGNWPLDKAAALTILWAGTTPLSADDADGHR
jgi:DEAD/DEAH box helicase domain-containing protein